MVVAVVAKAGLRWMWALAAAACFGQGEGVSLESIECLVKPIGY